MEWALWLGIGIGYGIGWLLHARHGGPRRGDGHQPTVPPANWDIPPPPAFTGYQPKIENPVPWDKVQRPQGTAAVPPRDR